MPREIQTVKQPVSYLGVFVAGALLLLSTLASFAGNTTVHKELVGVYVARVARTDPSMTVSLGPDATVTVTADPGTGSTTSFGHWTSEGNRIKVMFNAIEDQPAAPPMVFEVTHSQLKAVTWDHATWGSTAPPAMSKGYYKTKYLFWNTTMR